MTEEKAVSRVGMGTYVIGAIIVAIYCVIMTWLAGFNQGQVYPGSAVYYDIGFNLDYIQPTYFWMLAIPFIVSVITGLIWRRGSKLLNTQSLAVITTMLWVTAMIPTNMQAFQSIHSITTAVMSGDPWKSYALEEANMRYLVPDLHLTDWWQGYMYGGASPPWDLWVLPILWFILQGTFLYLMFIFAATLFRRQYLDVERLSYHLAVPIALSINESTSSEGKYSKIIGNKMLYFGLLVGVLLNFPTWVGVLWPGLLPGDYLWAFTYDATPLALPGFNYTPMAFIISGFAVGVALLIPVGILQSYLVAWAIFLWIIPQILVAAGVMSPMPTGWSHYSAALSFEYPVFEPVTWANLQWSYGLYPNWIFGTMWAIFFWPLLTAGRKNFIASIRAIFSKPPAELEANEPISYRWQWLGLIGCMVMVVLLMYIGSDGLMPLGYGIIWIIVTLVYCGLVATRFTGIFTDVSAYPGAMVFLSDNMPWSQFQTWMVANEYSPFNLAANPEAGFKTLMVSNYGAWGGTYWPMSFPAVYAMQSYNIARLTNTPTKKVFLGIVIATPVAFIASLIANVQFSYTYGVLEKWANSGLMGFSAAWSNLVMFMVTHRTYIYQWFPEGGTVPPQATVYIAQAGGFIITVALFLLRARFPWWPVHPVGIMAAMYFDPGFLLPIAIALVIKKLVIRTGGLGMWEKRGMPFAFGMAASYALVVLPLLFYNASKILSA